MQNVGVVNDHVHGCFRATVAGAYRTIIASASSDLAEPKEGSPS
jgi:hypothetical protein